MLSRIKRVIQCVLVVVLVSMGFAIILLREKGGRPSLLSEFMTPGISLVEVLTVLIFVAGIFYVFDDKNSNDPP